MPMSNSIEINAEDYTLIDRFLSGDGEAFDILVKKYQNYVINTIYSLSGKTQLAEDIAQEVFIKVYQNLSSFKKKAAFSTWLYRITVNTTYNCLKNKKNYVSLDCIDNNIDFRKTFVNQLDDAERQEIVRKAIASLPFKYRSVLVLKDIEGFSYRDIAQILGCRIGTVESRLFRARSILRKVLFPLLNKESEV